MTEEWRDVVGWESLYEISSIGRVRSKPRHVRRSNSTLQFFKGKDLLCYRNSGGYFVVRLSDVTNGRRLTARVHRLVAEAFIPNPESRPEVNHIDSDRTNARLENLEWATRAENGAHGYHHGYVTLPHARGSKNNAARLSESAVENIRRLAGEGVSGRSLAKRFSVSPRTIWRILSGETWNLPAAPRTDGGE
jgi:hypothetical protein